MNPNYFLELKHVPVFGEGVTPCHMDCHPLSHGQLSAVSAVDVCESPSVLSLFLWCAVTNEGDNTVSSYGLANEYGRENILF